MCTQTVSTYSQDITTSTSPLSTASSAFLAVLAALWSKMRTELAELAEPEAAGEPPAAPLVGKRVVVCGVSKKVNSPKAKYNHAHPMGVSTYLLTCLAHAYGY